MTFEQIGYFLALTAAGTFARAAKRCGISQPSLTNAIRSLEIALGARLFERTSTGSELTSFGRQMYPLLAGLHYERLRALQMARTSVTAADRMTSIRPVASKRRFVKSHGTRNTFQTAALAIAVLLGCILVASGNPAQASDENVEAIFRELLPEPVRCDTTSEPLLYCRHEDATRHTMVLDFTSSLDDQSASLTHDYDDAGWNFLFVVMRDFFLRLGVPTETLDTCISQSQWAPRQFTDNGLRVVCYRVELGDRVTHEIFVMAAGGTKMTHAFDIR